MHDGATGKFNWGDGNAFEDDFKANARGGHADQWVEQADIVYFTGHGSPSGFYFRSDVPDDSQVHGRLHHEQRPATTATCASATATWSGWAWRCATPCRWIAFQQGANRDVFDRWADAFEGCTPC